MSKTRARGKNVSRWHQMNSDDTLKALESSGHGLTTTEAMKRLQKFGPNELREEKKVSRLEVFLNQFKSFLVAILVLATIFSAFIGEIVDSFAILIIVILNSVFGYFQEYKAEKTIEALKRLTGPETTVVRGGREYIIPSKNLVPGDIILLEDGSRVTADIRLLETHELKIDESAITGESVTVTKLTKPLPDVPVADRKNMLWAGTMVTYGRGRGVVVNTGMNTELGRIAHIVEEEGEEPTPLQEDLDSFGKRLGIMILAICALVVIVGIARESLLTGSPVTQGLIATMAITGIALAVAAIPEGLPAVVTITLALGLQRLARHNALIRKLPSVETLGSTTVICADKTGTLTKNEMTVKKIWMLGQHIEVEGQGYEPKGGFREMGKGSGRKINPKKDTTLSKLLLAGALCSNARLSTKSGSGDGKWGIIGDPTEGALVVAAAKAGTALNKLESKYPRAREIPFSSERKMMTTLNQKSGGGFIVCTKGAPESLLNVCSKIADGNTTKNLTASMKRKILEANRGMADDALRILGIAYKETRESRGDAEKGLIFLGLVGMIDPPRENVKRDIALCRRAGIKAVMITGDNENTAYAIARQIGMLEEKSKVITGTDLDSMKDRQLESIVEDVAVYARVNPEHKLRIVDAFKKRGHIIAMTGDGVNDAPALKGADIGIAMGIKGTDVAKEASDMILRDDNFSSIVHAVKGGRGIYDNIKKFVQYLLSSNLGEVLIVFLAMLIGFTDPATGSIILPLAAIQLLWINLLTDGLPALALGVDPPSPGIMERKPRDPKKRILSRDMFGDIVMVGIIICIGTLFLFWLNLPSGPLVAGTVAFTTVVMFEMVRVQSVRMKYKIGIWSNKKLILAMAISIILQVIIIYVPVFQPIFNTAPLGVIEWLEIVLVSSTVLVMMQFMAFVSRRRGKMS